MTFLQGVLINLYKNILTNNTKRIYVTRDAEIRQGQINNKQISRGSQGLHSKKMKLKYLQIFDGLYCC